MEADNKTKDNLSEIKDALKVLEKYGLKIDGCGGVDLATSEGASFPFRFDIDPKVMETEFAGLAGKFFHTGSVFTALNVTDKVAADVLPQLLNAAFVVGVKAGKQVLQYKQMETFKLIFPDLSAFIKAEAEEVANAAIREDRRSR